MQQEFDYIIIGGGSAGCVLASRGSIKLSGPNIHDPLLIDLNFLSLE